MSHETHDLLVAYLPAAHTKQAYPEGAWPAGHALTVTLVTATGWLVLLNTHAAKEFCPNILYDTTAVELPSKPHANTPDEAWYWAQNVTAPSDDNPGTVLPKPPAISDGDDAIVYTAAEAVGPPKSQNNPPADVIEEPADAVVNPTTALPVDWAVHVIYAVPGTGDTNCD